MTRLPFLLMLAFLGFAAGASPARTRAPEGADAILGTWEIRGEEASARIAIDREGDAYVGRLVWLEKPDYPDDDPRGMPGRPRVDRNNPEPGLRDRPLIGLRILSGLRYDGRGRWKDGRIYAPDEGKSYRCRLQLDGDGALEIRAFKKILFAKPGRTMTWRRVPARTLAAAGPSAGASGFALPRGDGAHLGRPPAVE